MLQTRDFTVTGESKSRINYTFILRITENSLDDANNCSNVTAQAILKSGYSKTSFLYQTVNVVVKLGEQTVIERDAWRTCEGTEEHILEVWSGDIPHNEDGALQLQVFAKLEPWSSFNAMPPEMIVEGTIDLSPIILNVPPSAPDGLQAVYNDDGNILVQWQAAADADDNLQGYELVRSYDGGLTYDVLYSGNELSFEDENPGQPGMQLLYMVRAFDYEGAYSEWAKVSITVNSPPAVDAFPALYNVSAGGAPVSGLLIGRPVWIDPGKWADPDGDAMVLQISCQTKDSAGAESSWTVLHETDSLTQRIRIAADFKEDVVQARFAVSCSDFCSSARAQTNWLSVSMPYSFCEGQWMRPTYNLLPSMPYVQKNGLLIRHSGLIPDPESSQLGFGKLGEMILGG